MEFEILLLKESVHRLEQQASLQKVHLEESLRQDERHKGWEYVREVDARCRLSFDFGMQS